MTSSKPHYLPVAQPIITLGVRASTCEFLGGDTDFQSITKDIDIDIYRYVYIYIHIHTHIYIYIHTHTHSAGRL